MSEITTGKIALNPATPADLNEIEKLLRANDLPIKGVKKTIDCFILAQHEGRIVGVAGVEECGDYHLLRSVAVDETMRGRGIGRALVEWLVADAKANGLTAVYLLTTTAEDYFRRLGFETVPRDTAPAEVQNTAEFKELWASQPARKSGSTAKVFGTRPDGA